MECPIPFVFDGENCSCQEGDVVNGTTCVNILASVILLNSLQIDINNSIVELSNKTKDLENVAKILINSQQMKLDVQSLYQLSNQTQIYIEVNSSQLQQFILENYTKAETNLQLNTLVLDKRIFDNVIVLSNQLSTLSNTSHTLNQNITQLNQSLNAQIDLTELLTQNISNLNQTLTCSNQVIQQQQKLINSLIVLVECLNNIDQETIYGQCYGIDADDFSCSQKVYQSSFDLSVITYQVINSDNFTNNCVFSTITITNAFIDVSNNVYQASLNPLFQSQTSFTNLKIQFGAQTLSSGSFISTQSSAITINQMNIVSSSGSQLTVNTNSQLNILFDSPTGAIINNLLVNLSFASSVGNITLINNINGVFNISGYQVLGDYISTLTVAMIGINVQNSTINVNQVSFMPNIYNVGTCSSYLFGSSVSSVSSFAINNLAVIIGNNFNFLLLGSISTTTYNTNYYLFGGIIAYINTASSVIVNSVILDSCQKFSTSYVSYSVFLVGYVKSSSSNITIKNLCLQQNMTSTTIEFHSFGLIGYNSGNTSIQNASVTFSVQGAKFNSFGIIGAQYSNSIYAEGINLITSVSVSSSIGQSVGSVIGSEAAKNSLVQNASVIRGNVSGSSYVGGIIGCQYSDITIMNSSVQNSNVSGSYYIGGIIGTLFSNTNATVMDSSVQISNISGSSNYVGGIIGMCSSKLYLTNAQIKFVRIQCSGQNLGIIVSYNGGTYSFTTSTAFSNYINGVLQTDCTALLNSKPVTGC
ncbi:filamentous_hemagglutinin N-terminal domain-containing protein [Hexamita inflata]|uniref:Filamentous hemagglutinin N-terminal domain-containing protein n=1 Tax=Hexamita inflata TaxID=28002 RepID=A0AA86R3X1_9EUKA|nr:filamentous hemagglutinin N-terminal domain-containing protein [Hexamita inflata]